MTTLSVICSRAIGLLGAKSLGEDPSAEETSAVFDVAQNMFLDLVANGIGGPLTDVVISANYEAGENERITDTSGTATVTKPTTFTDALTGATRPPIEGAVVQIAGGATYAYVRSRGQWVQLNGLALTDTQPLGTEFDRHVAAMIAVRAAPELQVGVPDMTAALADVGRRAVSARFGPRLRGVIDRGLLRRAPLYNVYTDV